MVIGIQTIGLRYKLDEGTCLFLFLGNNKRLLDSK